MDTNWVGYIVSMKCGKDLGIFQGQISDVTQSTITLTKPFQNGIPYSEEKVTLSAKDIEDIKLISDQPLPVDTATGSSTITMAIPIAKRAGRTASTSDSTPGNKNSFQNHSKSKPIDIEVKQQQLIESGSFKNGTPIKRDRRMTFKDKECFGSSVEQAMATEFDFEKNLALFNKEAIWNQLGSSHRPDVVRQADKKAQKYRHNENVIATVPAVYRQIVVPTPDIKEYVTDDGLVVPSLTPEVRRQLFSVMERRGLIWDKQIELIGRAATEMALQLLGGAHRLNPNNVHQCPTVICLCSSNRRGALGINSARQLASHGVNTVVHLIQPDPIGFLKNELSLYKLMKNRLSTSASTLPTNVDLIIVALGDDFGNPSSYPGLAEWINQNKAPVLALDPPTTLTPGMSAKFSLVPVLPLAYSSQNGKIYLCNLGVPFKIFKEVGIKYKTPFGSKFVIPLHPNDT